MEKISLPVNGMTLVVSSQVKGTDVSLTQSAQKLRACADIIDAYVAEGVHPQHSVTIPISIDCCKEGYINIIFSYDI